MPTPVETHWDGLLEPITDDAPSGESLLYEGTYDQIKEARRQDLDLPQGDWQHDLKKADWREVEELCINALRHKSKDLQLVCWLTEALLNRYGHDGLRDGINLLFHMAEKFWDTAWPELEEDDADLRLAPFIWLNEKCAPTLAMEIAITSPSDTDIMSYNYYELERALSGGAHAAAEEDDEEEVLTYAKFLHSVSLTSGSFYQEITQAFAETLELTDRLNQFLDEHCGDVAPSLNRFRKALSDIHDTVNNLLNEKPVDLMENDSDNEDDFEETDADSNASAAVAGSSGPIRSRQEAYRRLSEASDYLLRTEPHSPTPYLVKRAVSWGNMSLSELLNELVNDEHDLHAIYVLLGMRMPE